MKCEMCHERQITHEENKTPKHGAGDTPTHAQTRDEEETTRFNHRSSHRAGHHGEGLATNRTFGEEPPQETRGDRLIKIEKRQRVADVLAACGNKKNGH
jgi:hypothetical protein